MDLFLPTIAYAADGISIKQLMFRISFYLINPLIIFGFVVALIYFIWGMLAFLRDRDTNATASNEGKQHMLYGIIGLTIMVSAFAIMRLIATAIGSDVLTNSSI